MNNVSLMGRLTRDPEVRYSANTQLANARFSVAVDRRLSKEKRMEAENNNQPTADFINCVAFGRTAEVIGQYFHKGNRIAITGHIQTGSYENQQGQRIYTTDVIVDQFDFVESGNSQPNSGNYQGYSNNNQSFNNNSFQNNNFQNSNDIHKSNDDFGMGDNAVPTDIDELPF
ncbi:single-stranded DNA-binding protein [Finegoldia magna]|uniref:single-stranded DNA-binding protein n=1 Tax=Finegoldia magna TaxID=1260 RepID=UPI000B9197EA|nr:single-stranded DNA-binding protein [Finegoldia magna]MDU1579292.1 single-stranded DNA-binding protein [Finegoldia magna]MDU1599837.1 single-stranded DNA-binding protein [Finegoldia magna]MDU2220400.1 single-stranded DNA-binding protein [Finegoldia magna]MDU2384116.1 single-stranded DNA-binding protein [Finegoldia magna]MDU4278411.1 single-stranded DNA-binding protein [Finegoldia magna]